MQTEEIHCNISNFLYNDIYITTSIPSCLALPCLYQLPNPANGSITCSGTNVTGDECSYSCDFGFYLEGPQTRTCQPNGTWSGSDPLCLRLTCPEQQPQSDSLLLLPCDNEFESVCTIACEEDSYIGLNDQFSTITCVGGLENNTEWSDAKTCMGMLIEISNILAIILNLCG